MEPYEIVIVCKNPGLFAFGLMGLSFLLVMMCWVAHESQMFKSYTLNTTKHEHKHEHKHYQERMINHDLLNQISKPIEVSPTHVTQTQPPKYIPIPQIQPETVKIIPSETTKQNNIMNNNNNPIKNLGNDIKNFISEHRQPIYYLALTLFIDHFFLNGQLTDKIKKLSQKLLDKIENSISGESKKIQ